MMPVALAAFVACPAWVPGDSYPVPMLAECPAPVGGELFPFGHLEDDVASARKLAALEAASFELEAVAREHADEVHPLTWVLLGAAAGGLAAWSMVR